MYKEQKQNNNYDLKCTICNELKQEGYMFCEKHMKLCFYKKRPLDERKLKKIAQGYKKDNELYSAFKLYGLNNVYYIYINRYVKTQECGNAGYKKIVKEFKELTENHIGAICHKCKSKMEVDIIPKKNMICLYCWNFYNNSTGIVNNGKN